VAGALGLGLTIYSALQGPPTVQNIAVSAVSGAVSGAVIGSAIFPGIGTAVGAIAGALLGGGAGAFGKGGQVKKPSAQARSEAEAARGGSALSQAIAGASTAEELVSILNRSWSPHFQVRIFARRSARRPEGIAPYASSEDQVLSGQPPIPGQDFQIEDLFDPLVQESIEVWTGAVGQVAPNAQLTEQLRQKVLELAGRFAEAEVFTEEVLPGGITRRITVPGALASRLRGLPLGVNAGSLPEESMEDFLKSLLAYDDDRDLRVVRRDPDTGYVVSVTSFAG
jgi:hypothetical protein